MPQRPDVAVITMARDEGALLPLWVAHYGKHVGHENLVVLDDNSTDGSTDGLGCTVHRIPPLRIGAGASGADDGQGPTFENVRLRLVNGIAQGLLAVYDYVVFVDVDEFIITDPGRYPTFPDLIEDRGRPEVLGVVGLNLVHVPDLEPGPLDLARPLLEQRQYAKFTPLMCKPSIKRVNARWAVASHGIRGAYHVDPELFMVHLKFGDRSRLADVAAHRNAVSRADGRAEGASWGKPADEILAAFDRVTSGVDPASVPEFDAGATDVSEAVILHRGLHRTKKQGQMAALKEQPLVRVPSRLKGAL